MASIAHATLRDYHSSTTEARSASLLSRAVATLSLWRARIRQKHLLALLDERDWHDMGVSQSDVYAELNRPFWRAPPR